ncbi:alpha/beta hydrolase [Sutcliffiella cohnii]|uniref:alpha/beta hydrolase n=1 Tax=Sutcliffiella cohnii TaxID=33932 RepID=UPI002E236634|nr:alpha/beta hydrolase [Sutcliffiella cohnii]
MRQWLTTADNKKGTIVIVHSALDYHGRYELLIKFFNRSGFHVIMGDLPGQGLSTRRKGHIESFEEYINEVDKWVKQAYLLEPPVFVYGHSIGGLAVIRTLQKRQDLLIQGVILSSPSLELSKKPSKGIELFAKGLDKIKPSLLISTGLSIEDVTRNEEMYLIGREDAKYSAKISVHWYREVTNAMKLAFNEQDYFPYELPLLVLQAGDDQVVEKESTIQWFDRLASINKSYREFNGLYHELFNEPEREQVYRHILAFLQLNLEGSD